MKKSNKEEMNKINGKFLVIGSSFIAFILLLSIVFNMEGVDFLAGNSVYNEYATDSNATSSNATSSNVSAEYYVLHLNDLQFSSANAVPGERIYVSKNVSGAEVIGMSLGFIDSDGIMGFNVPVQDIFDNPYFEVPDFVATGKYILHEVSIYGMNADGSTFNKQYARWNNPENYVGDVFHLEFQPEIYIHNDKVVSINLENISISPQRVNKGNNVSVNIASNVNLEGAKLIFKNSEGLEFNTNVKNLNNNPYITIGNDVKAGDYSLFQVILTSVDNTKVFTDGLDSYFGINLSVQNGNESNSNKVIYNNENINEIVVKNIYNETNNITINIDATSSPVVSSSLFDSIKGTNKKLIINYQDHEIIFDGENIADPKTINIAVNLQDISKFDSIRNNISDGMILEFAPNGNLPGRTLIRLNNNNLLKSKFNSNPINIYYYNEKEQGYEQIARNVELIDGYYDFTINHNSKYVLTQNPINESLVIESKNAVNFQSSNTTYIALIIVGICLIVGVVVLIVVMKKRNTK